MRIGIDARFYGIKDTGIGRYVRSLVLSLAKIDHENTYLIFGGGEIKNEIVDFDNFVFIPLDTLKYSLKEQLINPFIFLSYRLDLLHVPHFNAPLLYPKKMIVTIHDLIKHLSVGTKTTTHNPLLYHYKHLAYKILVNLVVQKADKIITPSEYWKNYLQNYYHLKEDKVVVTYEGIDVSFLAKKSQSPVDVLEKYNLSKPFIFYTGNLYPHKNIDLAVKAVEIFNKSHNHKLMLAIACSRSIFRERYQSNSTLKVLGFVPDSDLAVIYKEALALVQPSFIEGFGLIGLEAMAASLPVLSSNASCLPEIYQDAALYFDPHKVDELVSSLHAILTSKDLRDSLIQKGLKRIKFFSWSKMAKQTLNVYNAP